VRAINLIPMEQRRGSSARGPGARTGAAAYAVLGGLGVAVACVLGLVMTSNSINSKTDKLAGVQAQSQGEKQVADALRPYGQFAELQRARHQQISSLTTSRFDWERALRQLSLAIPRNAYLLDVAATANSEVQVGGGSGGGAASLREKSTAPAFAMTGCTYSQHAVARMMTRMRNLDDVTAVHLAKSVRKEDTGQSTGGAVTSDQSQPNQDISDCVGSSRVTKFDILVVFGGSAAGQAATAGQPGVPAGSAAPIAAAQGAAAQGGEASAAAGASAGGTP
jgi:Tfp pilus assembly protein PilN